MVSRTHLLDFIILSLVIFFDIIWYKLIVIWIELLFYVNLVFYIFHCIMTVLFIELDHDIIWGRMNSHISDSKELLTWGLLAYKLERRPTSKIYILNFKNWGGTTAHLDIWVGPSQTTLSQSNRKEKQSFSPFSIVSVEKVEEFPPLFSNASVFYFI